MFHLSGTEKKSPSQEECAVMRTCSPKRQVKTIIIIAHRLSTIVNCDKLIYIENGAAVMEGTHKELMKNCLGYKNLYKIENKIG